MKCYVIASFVFVLVLNVKGQNKSINHIRTDREDKIEFRSGDKVQKVIDVAARNPYRKLQYQFDAKSGEARYRLKENDKISLVGELQSNAATTNIMKGSNGFTESGDKSGLTNVVRWSPGNTSGGPNESGGTSRPSFIGLGHELAHSYDKVTDGKVNYAPWPGVTGAAKAEMFATHVENMLRAENQIPLRTHYGINNSSGSPVYEGPLVYPGTRASTNPQFNQYVPFLDEWLPYVYQH
jgi:hypothetical protein